MLVQRSDKNTEFVYDYEISKKVSILVNNLLQTCKDNNADFSLCWKMNYRQYEKDASIIVASFDFQNINQNNLDLLYDTLAISPNSIFIQLILNTINFLRREFRNNPINPKQ